MAYTRPESSRWIVDVGPQTTLDRVFAYGYYLPRVDAPGAAAPSRQWRDVVRVLTVSGGFMDAGYLTEWGKRIGVALLLQKALEDAALP